MTQAQYGLAPIYGFADWKPVEGKSFTDASGLVKVPAADAVFGGGSVLDNDNLVQGIWTMTGNNGNLFGFPTEGAQLMPLYAQPDIGTEEILRNAVKQVASSKTAAKFLLSYAGKGEQFFSDCFAVLRPQGDIRQKYISSLNLMIDIANSTALGNINRSMLQAPMWSARAVRSSNGGGFGFIGVNESPLNMAFSFGGGVFPFFGLPILLSDGSDGEYPRWVGADVMTPADVPRFFTEAEEAIRKGEFWIPFYFSVPDLDADESAIIELAWPHSGALAGA